LTPVARRRLELALLLTPAVFFVLGVFAYPLGLAVWLSLTDASIGETGHFVGLTQYRFLFSDPNYRAALSHTVEYTGLALAGKLVLGTLLALALLPRFRGRRVLYALLLLPLLFPVVMDSITWYFLFSDVHGGINAILLLLGLVHEQYPFLGSGGTAMLSLVAVNIWHGTPLFTILALAALRSVSRDHLDSAVLDGARSLALFRYIQLPALVPALTLASLLSVLGTFGDYAIVHIMTAGGPGGETHIVSSLAFTEALRGGDLAGGIATALSVVPFYLAGLLLLVLRLVARR
jgi:multiple sugar transport system permease protein